MERTTAPLGVLAALGGLALLGLMNAIGFGSAAGGSPPGAASAFVVPANRSAEAEQLLGHGLSGVLGASGERLARLEAALRPIFTVLPKSGGDGMVNQAAASYALHRFFASYNAWSFKEFTPLGKGTKMAQSNDGDDDDDEDSVPQWKGARVESKVADLVADVLEVGADNKLVSLQDLLVLAATVEDLVQGESMEQLVMAYQATGLSVLELLNLEQRKLVLDAFVVNFIAPKNSPLHDQPDVAALREAIEKTRKKNPFLDDTLLWAADFEETGRREDRMRNPFVNVEEGSWDFSSMGDLVEDILSKIGRVQASDCSTLKRELLELEDNPTSTSSVTAGSIDLELFHQRHLNDLGITHPGLSRAYMTRLGALDVKDPEKPRAIVSNYVYASAMCLPTPGAIKLCCANECHVLMESLERSIVQPAAAPEVVGSVVAALPSTNVAAPRKLPGFLLRGLDRIADQHGGQVPLHSEAFARWMHRAFPAECPNPSVPGAAHAPWVGEAFVESLDGGSGFMTKKEAKQHRYDASAGSNETDETDDFFDVEEEELVVVAETPARPRVWAHIARVFLRMVALAAVVIASGFAARGHLIAVKRALGGCEVKKDDDFFI